MNAALLAPVFLLAASPAPAQSPQPLSPQPLSLQPVPVPSGYPTMARVDYVIGCMAANGQTQDALRRCSCSIDTIAAILPYDAYVQAETVLAMRGQGGERASLFSDVPQLRAMAQRLREAQVEADFRCF